MVDTARYRMQAGAEKPIHPRELPVRTMLLCLAAVALTACGPAATGIGTAEQLLGLPRLGQASSYPTMTAAFHL